MGRRGAGTLVLLVLVAASPITVDPTIRAWAFITPPKAAMAAQTDATAPRSLPGATARFTDATIGDLGHTVDWFPKAHAPMPPVVADRGGAMACGYCHLAGGEGRVENASLAGVPANYIREQVAAFATDTRTAAAPDYLPSRLMNAVAKSTSPADVAAAATYFSAARFVSHVRVVEAATIPATVSGRFIRVRAATGTEPIADRIVEMPDDMAAFELRDPRVTYTAFVPPGSLARGRAVVARIGCAACHGAGMKLWGAGRSPTYIFRQLLAFRSGARHDVDAAPMTAVAARLTPHEMIAVAAYWGSLRP
jgi:cytochrome c553